jgi:hypothetical protein
VLAEKPVDLSFSAEPADAIPVCKLVEKLGLRR